MAPVVRAVKKRRVYFFRVGEIVRADSAIPESLVEFADQLQRVGLNATPPRATGFFVADGLGNFFDDLGNIFVACSFVNDVRLEKCERVSRLGRRFC